jgi:hypothetical protein
MTLRIGDRMALMAMQTAASELIDALEEFFCTGQLEHLKRARQYLKATQESDSLGANNDSYLEHIINELEKEGEQPCEEN